ncbi:PIN domain-containing protein [Candidatus Poriferisocius sp.]|uniref:PIN domain-containing protein n=1 Tax=Candidatus Poriferisocius sp. TaxID=3101276 RepID=UPI003B59A090
MILDTSFLLSAFVPDQTHHHACARILASRRPLVVSPFVLAELDYLTAKLAGSDAQSRLLRELSSGAYEIAVFDQSDLLQSSRIVERYQDQQIGLADASLILLADRYGTDTIATLDQRHFRVVRSLDGRPFTILPSDAQASQG